MKKWIILGGAIILILGFIFNTQPHVKSLLQNGTNIVTQNSPTPMPFEELTIPYLRKKEFKGSLGERQLLSNNGSYTSYLTSYTSDGFKINGFLTIPNPSTSSGQAQKFPAIVFVHGYIPPAQYATLEKYGDYVDYLARNGFVVFKIDLRGHGESEGQAGGGYFGADYIADTLNAYSALQNSDFVDGSNIGLWGHSMAGNVLLRGIAVKPDIKAVVIWAGAVYSYADREKYGIGDSSFQPSTNPTGINRRQRLTEMYGPASLPASTQRGEQGGQASSGSAFWKQMAPTNYLSDLKGAIEIHHAVDDDVVNVGYSRDLVKLLEQTSVTHQLFEYESGGHNISGESFNSAMQRTVDFFKKHLK